MTCRGPPIQYSNIALAPMLAFQMSLLHANFEQGSSRMTSNQLVTAVIPSLRSADIVERAISSVRNQSYQPIEVVVVHEGQLHEDSNLSDGQLQSVKLVENESNGVSGARNTGIKAASGEFIAFLDDDDTWHPKKIELQTAALAESSSKVLGSYCGVRQIGDNGEVNAVKTPRVDSVDMLRGNPIGTFSVLMIRTEAVNAVGLLDTELKTWEDWDYYLRLFRAGSLTAVEEPLVDRISGDDQLSQKHELKNDAAERLLSKHSGYAESIHGGSSLLIAGTEFELGTSAIKRNQFPAARRHLYRVVREDPGRTDAWIFLFLAAGGKLTFRPVQRVKRALV